MSGTIVVCHSKEREHCKLIFGPYWEKCYFIRQGDIRDPPCKLIGSALSSQTSATSIASCNIAQKQDVENLLHEESAVYGRCRLSLSFTGICYMELEY